MECDAEKEVVSLRREVETLKERLEQADAIFDALGDHLHTVLGHDARTSFSCDDGLCISLRRGTRG